MNEYLGSDVKHSLMSNDIRYIDVEYLDGIGYSILILQLVIVAVN